MDPDAFDAFEAAGWADRAEAYARAFVPITSRVVGPLLDDAGVAAGTRVLDVATGPGHVAAACAARGADAVGLDISPGMVAWARSRYPDVEFRAGDAQRLPFDDGSMDAVVGNLAILHLGRPEAAVAEFRRVLRPGGRIALSTWDGPQRTRMVGIIVEAAQEAGLASLPEIPDGPPFFRFADEAEFAGLLREAGLTDVRVRTVAFRHPFGGPDELWEGIQAGTVRMGALIVGQPADARARMRAAYDRLVAPYAVEGGGLEIPISVKLASGAA